MGIRAISRRIIFSEVEMIILISMTLKTGLLRAIPYMASMLLSPKMEVISRYFFLLGSKLENAQKLHFGLLRLPNMASCYISVSQ